MNNHTFLHIHLSYMTLLFPRFQILVKIEPVFYSSLWVLKA